MKNLKTYESFLTEAKAVGILYHFTTPRGLKGILEYDEMSSAHGAISFTRNNDLGLWASNYGAYCRIALDGDLMSNKYKISPYLFDPEKDPIMATGNPVDINTRRGMYGDEREERIVKDMISGVKKYILQIDVMEWALKPKDKDLVNAIRSENEDIPFNSINKFAPYKKTPITVAAL